MLQSQFLYITNIILMLFVKISEMTVEKMAADLSKIHSWMLGRVVHYSDFINSQSQLSNPESRFSGIKALNQRL